MIKIEYIYHEIIKDFLKTYKTMEEEKEDEDQELLHHGHQIKV